MSRAVPPNEAQEVVQRVRCQFSKTGRMRYASHRDFQRSLERAVRRAGIPVAFSGGFSPRPRISYANAAPTGAGSLAEYCDIGLAEEMDAGVLADRLSQALPEGFTIVAATEAHNRLGTVLTTSRWELEFPAMAEADLAEAWGELVAASDVVRSRMTKSGMKDVDIKTALIGHEVCAGSTRTGESCAILRVVVHHTTPVVRPDDVLAVLVERTDLKPPGPVKATRLAQGPFDEGTGLPGDPLAERST